MFYLTLTLMALFLAGIAAVILALKHAPEGIEDENGFHLVTARRKSRSPHPKRKHPARARAVPSMLALH